MGPPVTLPSSLVGIREAIKGNFDSKEMQRTATAGFYAGFVGQGIEYTQIISKADYQLSLLIVTQKGLNAAANPLTYVEYFRNFSPQEKLEAAKRTAKGAWNGDYDSALGRKTGAAILDYLLVAIGGALMKGESAACEVAESGSTTADIYSFGNKSAPRGARPQQDFNVENFDSIVGPETGPLPKGASNVLDVNSAPLSGHYHMLPAGTQMPDGLDIIADGIDVIPNSPHGVGHHTIFPTRAMTVNEFNELYKSLPWQYGGKK